MQPENRQNIFSFIYLFNYLFGLIALLLKFKTDLIRKKQKINQKSDRYGRW